MHLSNGIIGLPTPITIAILGSGNIATHLSQAFEKAGHTISYVYSRNLNDAQELTATLKKATPIASLNFKELPPADVYMVCVSDAGVEAVMQRTVFPDQALVAHTSGSLPLASLTTGSAIQTGVFYPVQTFTKGKPVNLKETPIALESSDPDSLPLLESLAASISDKVLYLNSSARKQLHLAAVFACNFTNHLLGISQEILDKNQLPTNLLDQLVQTTVQKALSHNPFTVQTGPATRKEGAIMESHLKELASMPGYQEIYRILSFSIKHKAETR